MKLTDLMLKQIMPHCPANKRAEVLPILNKTCLDYGIVTELRIAAFLATLAVESGEFRYQEELASGDAYDTRTDLGNTPQRDGDGRLYKGHGRIQITGKTNHRLYTEYLKAKKHLPFVDFVKEPRRLAQEPYATDSAGWFFAEHIKANKLADKRQFLTIQVLVNGRNRKTGLPNHWDVRKGYYDRALRVLPDDLMLQERFAIEDDILPDDTHPDFSENTAQATLINEEQSETTKIEVKDGDVKLETSNNPPPAPTTETVIAPAKENSTATATKATILGITVPAFIGVAVKAVTDMISQGFVSAAQIGEFVLNLIKENQKYVLWIVIALIFLLGIKKLCKQITLWVQMWFAGNPSTNNVEVKPQ